jgi:hypothetical protein
MCLNGSLELSPQPTREDMGGTTGFDLGQPMEGTTPMGLSLLVASGVFDDLAIVGQTAGCDDLDVRPQLGDVPHRL